MFSFSARDLAVAIALPLLGSTPDTFSCWKALAALLGGALVGKTRRVPRQGGHL